MGILRENCVRAVCLQLILCFVFMLFACSTKAPEHPITVHLTIRCEDLENDAQAPKGVRTLLDTDCIIEEGTNVFDLVVARAKAAKLAISSKSSAFGRYFDGIGGYTEKDGPCAGWLFTVNGEMPSVSCDRYALSDHDTVEWVFRPDQRNAYGG